jgi:hypothetical protein
LESARRLASSDPAGALALTDTISTATFRIHGPAAGAVARLLRAEWYGALDRHTEAAAELLCAEHSDFTELPIDRVQAAEFDWALGTIALWRRAQHLEADGEHGDTLCRIYREVARRWQAADARHASRTERARTRATTLGCFGTP